MIIILKIICTLLSHLLKCHWGIEDSFCGLWNTYQAESNATQSQNHTYRKLFPSRNKEKIRLCLMKCTPDALVIQLLAARLCIRMTISAAEKATHQRTRLENSAFFVHSLVYTNYNINEEDISTPFLWSWDNGDWTRHLFLQINSSSIFSSWRYSNINHKIGITLSQQLLTFL